MNRTTWMRHSIPKTFHDENMIKKEEFQAAKSLKFFFFAEKRFLRRLAEFSGFFDTKRLKIVK